MHSKACSAWWLFAFSAPFGQMHSGQLRMRCLTRGPDEDLQLQACSSSVFGDRRCYKGEHRNFSSALGSKQYILSFLPWPPGSQAIPSLSVALPQTRNLKRAPVYVLFWGTLASDLSHGFAKSCPQIKQLPSPPIPMSHGSIWCPNPQETHKLVINDPQSDVQWYRLTACLSFL